jgi:hypothetical protein
VQEQSTGKQLFASELERAQREKDALNERRRETRNRFQVPLKSRLVVAAAVRHLNGPESPNTREPRLAHCLSPLLAAEWPSAAAAGPAAASPAAGSGTGLSESSTESSTRTAT